MERRRRNHRHHGGGPARRHLRLRRVGLHHQPEPLLGSRDHRQVARIVAQEVEIRVDLGVGQEHFRDHGER